MARRQSADKLIDEIADRVVERLAARQPEPRLERATDQPKRTDRLAATLRKIRLAHLPSSEPVDLLVRDRPDA